MNPQSGNKAKDFFLNLGATIALYTVFGSLINLFFTVINKSYPQISTYYYSTSSSISWPVAILVIFTPILITFMWILGKQYAVEAPSTIHKWLTYITLFIAGLIVAGDLITVLYYFIDGQELSTGFLLKVLVLLVVSLGVFGYYLTDVRGKLTPNSRRIWRIVSIVFILGSIILGFAVIGSPQTQRLYKYDDVKIQDLQNISNAVQNYYSVKGVLPKDYAELATLNYGVNTTDSQTQKSYEYKKTANLTYEVCADFNKASTQNADGRSDAMLYPYGGVTWTHPAGRYCFEQTINPNNYGKPMPVL